MSSEPHFKPRLHRLQTIFTPRPLYFLTACTANRQPLLANDRTQKSLTEFAERAVNRGVCVGRYVLMPDHLHLFAAFGSSSVSVSEWMKALKRSLASQLGIAWQRGFFDHVLRSRESYAEKWRYVLENPVRAGLVNEAREWPYQGEIHRLELKL